MKSIFIIFIVPIVINVFVLSLSYAWSYDYAKIIDMSPGDDDQIFFAPQFEYELTEQYLRRQIAIVQSWMECRDLFPVPIDQAIDLFRRPRAGDPPRHVSDKAKCLIDCTLRGTGVMSDDGLDVAEYMMQMRQLRFNYTSYETVNKTDETKEKILETIIKRASNLDPYDELKVKKNIYQWTRQITCKSVHYFRNHCYDLLRSYELAAQNCSSLRAPTGNDCETSWIIVRCVLNQNLERMFDGPFYPVQLKALQL